MADEEQLRILKQGVEAWNAWAQTGCDTSALTSRGADLRGSTSEANLSGANLSGADLSGADLRGANLSEANLRPSSGKRSCRPST